MDTLVFVAISVMNCYGNFTIDNRNVQRCLFEKEVIVKVQDLKVMKDKNYLLGPMSTQVVAGCQVTLENGEKYMGGKPCRRLIGHNE